MQDILTEILARDAGLARQVYVLGDCTSSVVVPGVIDYTDRADENFTALLGMLSSATGWAVSTCVEVAGEVPVICFAARHVSPVGKRAHGARGYGRWLQRLELNS
jgi:hypothetical protein